MIYFLACIAAIAGFLFGYDEGIIAVARPLLDKDFPMSPVVGGFMTAAVPLGALIGASLAGRITDRFGRRRVLMSAAALFAVGALIAAGMTAVWMLVAARLMLGLAIGVAAVAAPLYISEAAPVSIRGGLVATYQLAITFGILVSYLTGLPSRVTERGDDVRARRGAGAAVPARPCLPARIAALAHAQGVSRPGAGQPAAAARRGRERQPGTSGDGTRRRPRLAKRSATRRCWSRPYDRR